MENNFNKSEQKPTSGTIQKPLLFSKNQTRNVDYYKGRTIKDGGSLVDNQAKPLVTDVTLRNITVLDQPTRSVGKNKNTKQFKINNLKSHQILNSLKQ